MPDKPLVATIWDDGLTTDIPLLGLLLELQIKASFALTTGKHGDKPVWNNPERPECGWVGPHSQRAAYRPHDIWAHSHKHCHMGLWTQSDVADDFAESRQRLQEEFERPVTGICYPYGTASPHIVGAAMELGFRFGRLGLLTPLGLPQTALTVRPRCSVTEDAASVLETAQACGYAIVTGHTYELQTARSWQGVRRLYTELQRQARLCTLTDLCVALYPGV